MRKERRRERTGQRHGRREEGRVDGKQLGMEDQDEKLRADEKQGKKEVRE